MDVFGTIYNASALTGKIIDYVQTVRGGDSERSKLLSEVSSLQVVLSVLDERIKTHPTSRNQLLPTIFAQNGPLDQCIPVLRDLEMKLKPPSGQRLRKKLKWPMERGEVTDKLAQIERLKSLIMLVLLSSST